MLWIRGLGVSLVDLGKDSVPSGRFRSTKPLTILQIKVAMLKHLHLEAQVSDLTVFTFLPTLSYHLLSLSQLITPHSISSPTPSLPSSFESHLILFPLLPPLFHHHLGLLYITHCISLSLTRGSNLGPPGMARLRALAVKKDLRSNR